MRVKNHIIISTSLSAIIYYFTKSIFLGVINFIVGVFMDMDHLIDYCLSGPKKLINKDEFLNGFYFDKSGKIYVFLHSYELLIFWWIIVIYFKWYLLGIIVSFAFVSHLVFDQFSYNLHPLVYFFIFRIIKKFKLKELCFDKKMRL